MSIVQIIKERVPSLTLGNTHYQHYPIREMTRQESESILRHPRYHRHMILRMSDNARQANPETYYVVTFFEDREGGTDRPSINVIVTRQEHEGKGGNLQRLLPYQIANYRMVVIPHLFHYMETIESEDSGESGESEESEM